MKQINMQRLDSITEWNSKKSNIKVDNIYQQHSSRFKIIKKLSSNKYLVKMWGPGIDTQEIEMTSDKIKSLELLTDEQQGSVEMPDNFPPVNFKKDDKDDVYEGNDSYTPRMRMNRICKRLFGCNYSSNLDDKKKQEVAAEYKKTFGTEPEVDKLREKTKRKTIKTIGGWKQMVAETKYNNADDAMLDIADYYASYDGKPPLKDIERIIKSAKKSKISKQDILDAGNEMEWEDPIELKEVDDIINKLYK